MTHTTLQMISTVQASGTVELGFAQDTVADPSPDEVIVRMAAAPINPSDLGNMFAGADLSTAQAVAGEFGPGVRAQLCEAAQRASQARMGTVQRMGNEGAGVVIEAGESTTAQALLGKVVALRGRSYSELRRLPAAECLVLPEGTSPTAAASCFINPLTVLGMVETMRLEGHSALVHTAAASNLGLMLQRICTDESIPLVNIVRRPEQAAILRNIGATHVVDTSAEDVDDALVSALAATGATLAFAATGGGPLASRILAAMETALSRGAGYSRYGSTVHKQIYLYGSLQSGATELLRSYGMAGGVGGWLMPNFLARVGPETTEQLKQRVARELDTTFASQYSTEVALRDALKIEHIAVYNRRATGEKYLIRP